MQSLFNYLNGSHPKQDIIVLKKDTAYIKGGAEINLAKSLWHATSLHLDNFQFYGFTLSLPPVRAWGPREYGCGSDTSDVVT